MEETEVKVLKLDLNKDVVPDNFTGIIEWPAWYSKGKTTREYLKNGKTHRVDGPALEFFDGKEKWYLEGETFPVQKKSSYTQEWQEIEKSKYTGFVVFVEESNSIGFFEKGKLNSYKDNPSFIRKYENGVIEHFWHRNGYVDDAKVIHTIFPDKKIKMESNTNNAATIYVNKLTNRTKEAVITIEGKDNNSSVSTPKDYSGYIIEKYKTENNNDYLLITHFFNGNYHSNYHIDDDDEPSHVMFENGNLIWEKYFKNGRLHRENGPSIIDYKSNVIQYFLNAKYYTKEEYEKELERIKAKENDKMKIKQETVDINQTIKVGINHSELEEAFLKYGNPLRLKTQQEADNFLALKEGDKIPYDFTGVLKIVFNDGGHSIGYYKDRLLHREDNLPAYVRYDVECNPTEERYCLDGFYHRIDGPAVVNYEKYYEEWHYKGRTHRIDGPAFISKANGQLKEKYYFEGIEYSREEWDKKIKKLSNPPTIKTIYSDLNKTSYRIAANKTVKLIKTFVVNMMAEKYGYKPSSKSRKDFEEKMNAFFDSQYGDAMISMIVGIMLPLIKEYLPKELNNKIDNLSEEFRVKSMTIIGDEVLELFSNSLVSLLPVVKESDKIRVSVSNNNNNNKEKELIEEGNREVININNVVSSATVNLNE